MQHPVKRFRSSRIAYAALLGGLLLIVLFQAYRTLPSVYYHNMGWLSLAESKMTTSPARLAQAATRFKQAITWNPQNTSGWRGQALVAAQQGARDLTVASWRAAKLPPELVVEYGERFRQQGEPNAAMLTFLAATPLFLTPLNPAIYAANKVCQGYWADLATFPADFVSYCEQSLAQNGNNLLWNPQLRDEIEEWDGQYFFGELARAHLVWEQAQGHPAPSVAIVGEANRPHFGLYQELCLVPGTRLRFSGWFRVVPGEQYQARLLYVEWRQGGKVQGNAAQNVDSATDWTFFEREFVIPAESQPYVKFYPADVRGQGQVWLDDLRLEILAQPDVAPAEPICLRELR